MPDRMTDVVFLLVIAAGFVILLGLLRACDRIVHVTPVATSRLAPTSTGSDAERENS